MLAARTVIAAAQKDDDARISIAYSSSQSDFARPSTLLRVAFNLPQNLNLLYLRLGVNPVLLDEERDEGPVSRDKQHPEERPRSS